MSKVVDRVVIPLKDIVVLPERGRKSFRKIPELAESLKSQGFINPIYVNKNEQGQYVLVAGERRFRAAIFAGMTEVPVSLSTGLSTLEQKIIELEENVYREDLDWQEQAELHRQINVFRKQQDPTWNQTKTAELVGLTKGALSAQITVAEKLKERPELKAKIGNLDFRSAMKVIDQTERVERVNRLQAQGKLEITTDLLHGDCRKLIKNLKTHSVDLLIMDPPYGMSGLEKLRESDGSVMQGHALMSETHNMTIGEVLVMLSDLAPELHRVLRPGAHMYIFSCFEYVGDFIKALAPFQFQPPCLIWDRGRNTAPAYGYQYLNRTEAIIFGHNPPRSRRLSSNMYNIIEEPTVPNALRVYPTEKPQALLKTLMKQSSITNDLVLDCFAGSASTLKAARELGRRSIGFEIDEDAWKRAQLVLAGVEDEDKSLFDGAK